MTAQGGKSSNVIIYLEIFHWDLKYHTIWLLPSRKPILMSCPWNCLIPKPVLSQCAVLSKTSLCAETISMEVVFRDLATFTFVHCPCCCLPWLLQEKVHRTQSRMSAQSRSLACLEGPISLFSHVFEPSQNEAWTLSHPERRQTDSSSFYFCQHIF